MFLPALINSLLRDEKFSMTDGNQTRDYIFVEDVVAAILKTLTLKNIPTTPIFNLGSGCSVTIKELAIKVSNIIGGDRRNLLGFGEKSHLPNALMKYQVNIQKASTMLNWRPQTLINDGLKLTIDYIKKSLK